MKAASYCRVSTEGQEQDGTSLETQMEACRKYCQARQYEVGYELSEAWSTRNENAPDLHQTPILIYAKLKFITTVRT